MSKPLTSSQATYEKLLDKKSEFVRLALEASTFKEQCEDADGNVFFRRPIIILNEENKRGWLKRITMINKLMDKLHGIDPERYPKNCSLIKNRPQLQINVTYCRVHLNNAFTSRRTSPDSIIKRLQLALKKLENSHDAQLVISKDLQQKMIMDSIKYFKSNYDREIRIRTIGYNDVLTTLQINRYRNRPDDKMKVRVTDMGLFVTPKKDYKEIDFYQPEVNNEKPKNVVYKNVKRIPVPIPTTEELYWEDEVEVMRRKVDATKISDLIPIDMPPAI